MAAFTPPVLTVFNNGQVAANAKVYVYQTGTTTPVTTYSDAGLTTPNTNPIIADSNGQVEFFVGATTALKLVLKTSADALINTLDPVYPAANYTSGGSAAEASIVAAATTDLGSTGSNIVEISGSASITSFGSSASTAMPIYNCRLTGAPLLTNNATSLILPSSANIQGADGDTFVAQYLGSGNWKVLSYSPLAGTAVAGSGAPAANCQLQVASTTQVVLLPIKGNKVTFPSGYVYTVPSAGLASGSVNGGCHLDGAASATLTAATLYYVYLWYNSGSPALDFSTTSHAIDASTGIEIKTGDNTRVLVGMVYPQAGPVVTDSTTARLVASWFNRQTKYFANVFTADRAITQTSLTEVNSEIRGLFLTWGDAFQCAYTGGYATSGNSNPTQIAIGIDGVSTLAASQGSAAATFASDGQFGSFGNSYATTEGQHYLTLAAKTSTGSITFYHTGCTGLSASVII